MTPATSPAARLAGTLSTKATASASLISAGGGGGGGASASLTGAAGEQAASISPQQTSRRLMADPLQRGVRGGEARPACWRSHGFSECRERQAAVRTPALVRRAPIRVAASIALPAAAS